MAFELKQEVYNEISEVCRQVFRSGKTMASEEMVMKLMDVEGVIMHCPYHHYIIPAALLTLAAIDDGKSEDELNEWLDMAENRAVAVPGGFCGVCGACGAGVGIGIFTSVYSGASPMTVENWQWANESTGIALQEISKFPGPRCCKRTSFLALKAGIPYINSHCGTTLKNEENVRCKYHESNDECIEDDCPFYGSKVAIIAPDEKLPKVPEGINVCDCLSKPIDFTIRKGNIHWLKEVGFYVQEDEVICEGEVDKKITEFTSPCEGSLLEICIEEGEEFRAGDILGYIQPDDD